MKSRKLLTLLAIVPGFAGGCAVADERFEAAREEEQVRRYFAAKIRQDPPARDQGRPIKLTIAFSDLNDDGSREAVVLLEHPEFCGSGGCNTYILRRSERGYEEVASFSITHAPIRRLATGSNGWRDIGIWVEGGGILPGYEAALSFAGNGYPSNPTVPPARPNGAGSAGEVLIPRRMTIFVGDLQ